MLLGRSLEQCLWADAVGQDWTATPGQSWPAAEGRLGPEGLQAESGLSCRLEQ